MSRLLLTIPLLLTLSFSFGQAAYEPQILILSPNEVKYDPAFEKEIAGNNLEIAKQKKEAEKISGKEIAQQPANYKRMMLGEFAYFTNVNFFKQSSYLSEQILINKFIEKFPHLLIELKDVKSTGTPEDLQRISQLGKLQYVLNFASILFYRDNEMSYAKVHVQLYDNVTNTLVIDSSYIGDWSNPGFEFACKTGSLACTINNTLLPALDDVYAAVIQNNPTIKKERALRNERLDVTRRDYYDQPSGAGFVTNIIMAKDSNINLHQLYQVIVNAGSTKFVGFFVEKITRQNFKQLYNNKQDRVVNIINDKSIRDTGYLNNIPQTYAYIVKGVKYKGKWYYEKSNITYFEPADDEQGRLQYINNLQDWGFFKPGSTLPDPAFWETGLFSKDKNGLYQIVADQL